MSANPTFATPDGLNAACREFRNERRRAGSRAVPSTPDTAVAPTTAEARKDQRA